MKIWGLVLMTYLLIDVERIIKLVISAAMARRMEISIASLWMMKKKLVKFLAELYFIKSPQVGPW